MTEDDTAPIPSCFGSWHALLKRSDTLRSGGNAPLLVLSDMKGALGFFGVFLSFLSGECVVFHLQMDSCLGGEKNS